MDGTHREFVELAYALLVASDEEFPALLVRLHEHTCQHFEHEGKLMKACRFLAIGEHNSEHLRVLGELAHFSRGLLPADWGWRAITSGACPSGLPPILPPWIRRWRVA